MKMFGVLVLAAVLAVSVAMPQEVDSILLKNDNTEALPQEHEAAESHLEQLLENHRYRSRDQWHYVSKELRPTIHRQNIDHHNSHHHSVHELEHLKHLAGEAFKLAEKKKHEEEHRHHHEHHGIDASRIIDDQNKENPYLSEIVHKAKEHSIHHEHNPHHKIKHLEHKPPLVLKHDEYIVDPEQKRHHEHRPYHGVQHHEHKVHHKDRLPQELDHHLDKRVHPHHDAVHIYKQPITIYSGYAYAYLPYTERPLLHYEELPHHRNQHDDHERHYHHEHERHHHHDHERHH